MKKSRVPFDTETEIRKPDFESKSYPRYRVRGNTGVLRILFLSGTGQVTNDETPQNWTGRDRRERERKKKRTGEERDESWRNISWVCILSVIVEGFPFGGTVGRPGRSKVIVTTHTWRGDVLVKVIHTLSLRRGLLKTSSRKPSCRVTPIRAERVNRFEEV